MKARDALKRATRDVHDRLDAILSSYRLDQRDDYGAFLGAQAGAFLPVERALTAASASRLIEGWNEALRGRLLLDDLAALGCSDIREVTAPTYVSDADLLGGIYVLEGSRMGAAVLLRDVPAGFPRAFLAARSPAGRWGAFVATLERKLVSPVEIEQAKDSARRTFACFEQSAGQDWTI